MSKKILVADDTLLVQKILRQNFEGEGYEVITSADGQKALNLVYKEKPDLIVAEVSLPGLSGYELCRIIRENVEAHPDIAKIPVLILTTRKLPIDRLVGIGLGAAEYITKPFNTESLMAAVRRLLGIEE